MILVRNFVAGTFQDIDLTPAHASSLIRCSPGEDATNGFFVSSFIRRSVTTGDKRKHDVDISEGTEATTKKKKRRKAKKSSVVE